MNLLRTAGLPLSALEWTQITLAAITATTTIVCAAISAWVALQLKSPSGKRVGEMVERTEHLASANTMQLMQMNQKQEPGSSDHPSDDVS